MADFCGFLVFFMVKTVFLCPTFDHVMQKKLRISAVFCVFFMVKTVFLCPVGCHFAKALLVQAIYTRRCGYDDESVWGGACCFWENNCMLDINFRLLL